MKHLIVAILVFAHGVSYGCGDHNLPKNCRGYKVVPTEKSKTMAFDYEVDIQFGRLRERTHLALDAIVKYAAFRLRLKGTAESKKQAQALIDEWEKKWSRSFYDLGDHKPLSDWLAQKYMAIELILGVETCKTLRLDDIKVINYGIPVVFACVDQVTMSEYYSHLQPFLGVVAYWTSFFTCVGFTWGTGAFYCGPVSLGVEWLSEAFIAPRVNEPLWRAACKK